MKRWHEEQALMARRMKLEREKHAVGPDVKDGNICHCLLGIGFVRKKRPYDCGRPRCGLCHPQKKWPSRVRASEQRSAINFDLEANDLVL